MGAGNFAFCFFWLLHYCYCIVSAHWEWKEYGIEKWITGSGAYTTVFEHRGLRVGRVDHTVLLRIESSVLHRTVRGVFLLCVRSIMRGRVVMLYFSRGEVCLWLSNGIS
jgi:hypothetical protein